MEKKKVKKPSSTMSTRERMMARKKQFETKGSNSGIIYPKEGTMRLRLISQGPDKELGLEIIQFYLGKEKGGIISPATFDDLFQELDNFFYLLLGFSKSCHILECNLDGGTFFKQLGLGLSYAEDASTRL